LSFTLANSELEKQMLTFFQVSAKLCSLTKNSQRGIMMLNSMKELGLPISIENHFNHIVESCLRAGKFDKINDLISMMSDEKEEFVVDNSTLQIIVK
jgi:pentatricopeptide repeat protein